METIEGAEKAGTKGDDSSHQNREAFLNENCIIHSALTSHRLKSL